MYYECPLDKKVPDSCPRCCFGKSIRDKKAPLMYLKIYWDCTYPKIGEKNLRDEKNGYKNE